jgi:hypothetical protein
MNQQELTFEGNTFDAKLDFSRLARQAARVFDFMCHGDWHTLAEISEATGSPEASVSARLRDFRKLGCTVERRRRGPEMSGLHEYRVIA